MEPAGFLARLHPARRRRAEPAGGGRRALRALRERVGVPGVRGASATVPDLAVLGAHRRHARRLGARGRRLPGDGHEGDAVSGPGGDRSASPASRGRLPLRGLGLSSLMPRSRSPRAFAFSRQRRRSWLVLVASWPSAAAALEGSVIAPACSGDADAHLRRRLRPAARLGRPSHRRPDHHQAAHLAAVPADQRRGLFHSLVGVNIGKGRQVFEARVAATILMTGVLIGFLLGKLF